MNPSASIESKLAAKLLAVLPATVGIISAHASSSAVNAGTICIDAKPVSCPAGGLIPRKRLEVHFSLVLAAEENTSPAEFTAAEEAISNLLSGLCDSFFLSQISDMSETGLSIVSLAVESADSSVESDESNRAFSSVLAIEFLT